jgi:hypothetical protein
MSKRDMGPMMIEVVTPCADDGLRVGDRFEAVDAQALVAETAVEAPINAFSTGFPGRMKSKGPAPPGESVTGDSSPSPISLLLGRFTIATCPRADSPGRRR